MVWIDCVCCSLLDQKKKIDYCLQLSKKANIDNTTNPNPNQELTYVIDPLDCNCAIVNNFKCQMGLSIRRMWIVEDGQIGPKHLCWQVGDQNTRTHSHWMSLQKEQEGKYFEAGTLDRDQNRCRCPFNVLKSPSSRSELILFDRFWLLKTSYHYKFACALDMATIVCFYCYWT